ncbi:hypothetical protein MRB53_011779 [Persea americana]|uniref:Uncharacterized protein n=1 Tax=Persea americana TaxID=3435 RepID=A0ACC2LVI9_PERAE|nr:hypothetical protein MRB53_011779 [Persea americana]
MDSCVLSPFRIFPLENVNHSGSFPLIIYFNQAVEGITSSTVTVESIFAKNEDIVWRPLSSNNSGKSRAWVTYLKIPDLKFDAPKAYPVELETLSNEIALFRELLSEINCKIAKLTLARLLMAHDAIMSLLDNGRYTLATA